MVSGRDMENSVYVGKKGSPLLPCFPASSDKYARQVLPQGLLVERSIEMDAVEERVLRDGGAGEGGGDNGVASCGEECGVGVCEEGFLEGAVDGGLEDVFCRLVVLIFVECLYLLFL